VNERIRAREIRVIGPDGEQLGIMSPREALERARELELDLIEVAPNAKPPVCRIMDYGKFKYEQQKRSKAAAKKQKITKVKGIRFRANIAPRDLEIRVKRARSFLEAGDKVKFTGLFRGRQYVHTDLVRDMMRDIATELSDIAKIEKPPGMEGRIMTMVLAPDKKAESEKKAQAKKGESESGKGKDENA